MRKVKQFISEIASFLFILSMLSLIFSGIFFQKPSIFGYRIFFVMSGSMEPTIKTGSFLLAKTIQAEEVRMGDIVAYRKGCKIIIHRVVEIEEEEGKKKFITKGDNNESADVPVEEEKIQYIILGIDAS